MARADSRDTMIGAFTAWTVCGLLWFFAFLSALSVGGVVLILAIVLTILLGTHERSRRFRLIAWGAFGVWLVWWVLVVAGPAQGSAGWMLYAGVAFLLLAVRGGPAALGLPFGIGVFAFVAFTWLVGDEWLTPREIWAVAGLAVAALSFALWVLLSLRATRRSRTIA